MTFPLRCHAEITCWQSNQWKLVQVCKCHFYPPSPRVGDFLLVPSSWNEPVIQTNSELSHNYRLVSTDFHQQLCMWWSGRNVNESSIGVNQLQASQWPPQHSLRGPLCGCQTYTTLLSILWWSQWTIRRCTQKKLFSSTPGCHKRKCFPSKTFYFLLKVYVHSLHYSWLIQSLHLISKAISSSDRSPRGSWTHRNSTANGSWGPLCSINVSQLGNLLTLGEGGCLAGRFGLWNSTGKVTQTVNPKSHFFLLDGMLP